ncbi:MFS transporter [Mycolicibacterium sp. XJ662]
MSADGDLDAHTDRYGVLLTQGTFYTTGMQLANIAVVLPFICAEYGNLWAAALVFPAYCIGAILGNSMSPFVLERSRHQRHLVLAGTSLAMAALLVVNGSAAVTGLGIAPVFLTTSVALGVASGLARIAFSDVLSSKLNEIRRGDLILNQSAAGAVVAIVAAVLVLPILESKDPLAGHVDLLWLGTAGLVAAAVAGFFIGPIHSHSARAVRRLRDVYQEGLAIARSHHWFRRYVVVQLLFVPIALSTTFYSLYTAEDHADDSGTLHILVIATSAGLIVGAGLWGFVHRTRFASRGMLVASALVSSSAAVLCIVGEAIESWSDPWVHGVVILMATVANQAIVAAATTWINIFATEHQRATLLGFSAVLVAVATAGLGVVLGGIAHNSSAIWPVVVLLLMNVAALPAALHAPMRA